LRGVFKLPVGANPTVSVVDELTAPEVAVIAVRPVATPAASPCDPEALLMVAIAAGLDVHVTLAVRFCWLLSVKVPVAMNCCAATGKTTELAGVTESETRTGGRTVTLLVPLTDPEVAEIMDEPGTRAVTSPVEPMEAADGVPVAHATRLVRS